MGDAQRGARARPPAPGRDPGLQPERTRLAWRRTTLSCTVVALLAGRRLLRSTAPFAVDVALAALVALLWLTFVAVSHRRVRALATGRPPGLPAGIALLLAGCTVTLAVFGAAIVVS
ncbi:DUF202 domain-containing protein [Streptomyces chattanoogensis]|uniref:DUF202 domain-containing protein n=1 Tax=Streptomyces chattanoogensis TaxID=66876 RepID=UPI003687E3B3